MSRTVASLVDYFETLHEKSEVGDKVNSVVKELKVFPRDNTCKVDGSSSRDGDDPTIHTHPRYDNRRDSIIVIEDDDDDCGDKINGSSGYSDNAAGNTCPGYDNALKRKNLEDGGGYDRANREESGFRPSKCTKRYADEGPSRNGYGLLSEFNYTTANCVAFGPMAESCFAEGDLFGSENSKDMHHELNCNLSEELFDLNYNVTADCGVVEDEVNYNFSIITWDWLPVEERKLMELATKICVPDVRITDPNPSPRHDYYRDTDADYTRMWYEEAKAAARNNSILPSEHPCASFQYASDDAMVIPDDANPAPAEQGTNSYTNDEQATIRTSKRLRGAPGWTKQFWCSLK